MLQPTRITVSVVVWFVAVITGTAIGMQFGAKNFGLYGGMAGGILGLALGHVLGMLSHAFRTRRLLRKIDGSSDDELQRLVNLDHWDFSQSFALLVLAARNHDVRAELPRIIAMLESDEKLTRVYGWDALRLVFNEETAMIGDYDPSASTQKCRSMVSDLRVKMEEAKIAPPSSPS